MAELNDLDLAFMEDVPSSSSSAGAMMQLDQDDVQQQVAGADNTQDILHIRLDADHHSIAQDVEIVTESSIETHQVTSGHEHGMDIVIEQVPQGGHVIDNVVYAHDIGNEVSIASEQYIPDRSHESGLQQHHIQSVVPNVTHQIIQPTTSVDNYYITSDNQLAASNQMTITSTIKQELPTATKVRRVQQQPQLATQVLRVVSSGAQQQQILFNPAPNAVVGNTIITGSGPQFTLSPNARTIASRSGAHSAGNVIFLTQNTTTPTRIMQSPKIMPKSPQRVIAPAPAGLSNVRLASGQPLQIVKLMSVSQGGSATGQSGSPMRTVMANRSGQKFIVSNSGGTMIPAKSASGGQVIFLPSNSQVIKSSKVSSPSSARTSYVPIAPSPSKANSTSQSLSLSNTLTTVLRPSNTPSKPDDPSRPRKPCNCTKSGCLKLYCDCFANGEFCNNCNCNNCSNNLANEPERQKAIKQCLERNPEAFRPKIGKSRHSVMEGGLIERRHTKGCNCRRSGCLKNYCECYEAKILCSGICKCEGCKNFEESYERKNLMSLNDSSEYRSSHHSSIASKVRWFGADFRPKLPVPHFSLGGQGVATRWMPCSYMTQEVMESTAQCLLARAEEAQVSSNGDAATAQRLILEEFGRCFNQIIQCAVKKQKH